MAIPDIIADGFPHSPITALMNKSKNIEFKMIIASFIKKLQVN